MPRPRAGSSPVRTTPPAASTQRRRDRGKDTKPAPSTDDTDRLQLLPEEDARDPIVALAILGPLALLAELLRYLGGNESRLLLETEIESLGAHLGLWPPLLPVLALAVGCCGAHLLRRQPWRRPGAILVLRVVAWSALWASVAYCLHFTTWVLVGPVETGVPRSVPPILARIGETGLTFSGALQEELLFRGLLLGGLVLIARTLGLGPWAWYALALPISAAVFSLAHTSRLNHHPAAEAFLWSSFIQRCASGMLYGLIFLRQGLPTAVLAHWGYNLAILWRLGPWS